MESDKKQSKRTPIKKKLTPGELEQLKKLIGKDYIVKGETWRLPPDGKS